MEMVNICFTVNPQSIEEPKSCLGYFVVKLYYEDGQYACNMVSNTYIGKAINNIKKKLEVDGYIFNKNLSNMKYSPKKPFSTTSYCPELDTSVECSEKQVTL